MASALAWVAWAIFVLIISLLFFAAFGGSKYERSGTQGNL